MAALTKGYRSPIWMTFKQAIDLGGAVRKGEKGSLTVFANKLNRTETDAVSGETSEAAIHYMKGTRREGWRVQCVHSCASVA